MKRFSKVSFDDIKTIQVDSGVLMKDFDVANPIVLPENVICATSGGINPVCAPEYYDFGEDVDNAKPSKETKRIRGWNATISFTTLTTSLTAIKLALGAADISGKVLSLRQRLQYAKDFKDIWWVGKRADDKLLAIRLIRSLSDSGFSLQTTKKGKGQISVTLKGHSSFPEKDKIPMEIYVFAESDIPVTPDEPVTSEMHIYGTPAKVAYNGVEFPQIPAEIMAYDYVYIYEMVEGRQYIAYGFDTQPTTVLYENPLTSYETVKVDSGTYGSANWYATEPDEWIGVETNKNVSDVSLGYISNKSSTILWSNFDIIALDGTITLAASDPVYSGNIGLRSGESVTYYNGTVLPDINTVYTDDIEASNPYAAILKTTNGYIFAARATAFATRLDTTFTGSAAVKYIEVGGAWTTAEYALVGEIVWANHDIYAGDNSPVLVLAATDPIQVGEIVDTINGIPIYEIKE